MPSLPTVSLPSLLWLRERERPSGQGDRLLGLSVIVDKEWTQRCYIVLLRIFVALSLCMKQKQ